MSVLPTHSPPPSAAYTDEPIYRLTVDQYHELIRAGKLTSDDPVELLEGILLFKMPKKTPHATATRLCRRVIETVLPDGWFYDSQEPITLSDGEPEPDGVIVRGAIEDYADRHPGPSDTALVIEVSDTTLERDRGIKLRSYARAGISTYWILNLNSRTLEAYTKPMLVNGGEPGYSGHVTLTENDDAVLPFAGTPAIKISVATLLPARVAG